MSKEYENAINNLLSPEINYELMCREFAKKYPEKFNNIFNLINGAHIEIKGFNIPYDVFMSIKENLSNKKLILAIKTLKDGVKEVNDLKTAKDIIDEIRYVC